MIKQRNNQTNRIIKFKYQYLIIGKFKGVLLLKVLIIFNAANDSRSIHAISIRKISYLLMAKSIFIPGFISFASFLLADKSFNPKLPKDYYFTKLTKTYNESLKFNIYSVAVPILFSMESFLKWVVDWK